MELKRTANVFIVTDLTPSCILLSSAKYLSPSLTKLFHGLITCIFRNFHQQWLKFSLESGIAETTKRYPNLITVYYLPIFTYTAKSAIQSNQTTLQISP